MKREVIEVCQRSLIISKLDSKLVDKLMEVMFKKNINYLKVCYSI